MYFGKYHLIGLVIVTVLTSIYVQNCCGQSGGRGHRRQHQRMRHGARRVGGMNPSLHQAYLDVYQQTPSTERPMWSQLAPRVPAASEVECFVEIITVQQRGGRCIQLGGNISRPYICQSGEQIEFSPYCHFVMSRRAEQQPIEGGDPQD